MRGGRPAWERLRGCRGILAPVRVSVDKDMCIGAGQCVVTAPDVFDQDDDGMVELLTDSPAEADRDAVKEAEHVCPARVITVEG